VSLVFTAVYTVREQVNEDETTLQLFSHQPDGDRWKIKQTCSEQSKEKSKETANTEQIKQSAE